MTALGFSLLFTLMAAFAGHSAREDWRAGVIHGALTNSLLGLASGVAAVLALASLL